MTATNEERTPESGVAIELCKEWACEVRNAIPCKVYLFGSAIYRGGDQFDAQVSDLDIIVVFCDELDETERVKRLERLKKLKHSLELRLIPALERTNCKDAGVSVVPITKLELKANIHKSGTRHFFDKNIFLDLETGKELVGLPDAGTVTFPDESRQALEFAQKIRNEFLAVSANGSGGIKPFDGADPLPKPLARVAAQLDPKAGEGEWYDTRRGLELLCAEVSRQQSRSELLEALYWKISSRRGARGRRGPLTDRDQVLLAEILHGLVSRTPPEPVTTWEIRFTGKVPTRKERERLVSELRRFVPDGNIIRISVGSIIVRLRSSKRSYATIQRLFDLGVLPKLFDVSTVEIIEISQVDAGFGVVGPIERIVSRIRQWRPPATDSRRMHEEKLASWLNEWLFTETSLRPSGVTREALVGEGRDSFRADILVRFRSGEEDTDLVVELFRLRSRFSFFHQLERLFPIAMPAVLVVMGSQKELDGLNDDIKRFAQVYAQIVIVTVPLDDEPRNTD